MFLSENILKQLIGAFCDSVHPTPIQGDEPAAARRAAVRTRPAARRAAGRDIECDGHADTDVLSNKTNESRFSRKNAPAIGFVL